ncbi:MAG: hypothetical protein NT067_01630 [Candidatus Diapherotrites archaeon]|nr:hypothetical protein [Candidatus Diapherotrites archaeon]
MKTALYCIVILSCLFFTGFAFALPNCNMVYFELYNAELWAGSTDTFTYAVNNTGNERFYIERVNAFDFEGGISVEEEYWDDVVLPGEKALVAVSVEADSGIEEGERAAKIELNGHFLGGKKCYYKDVHGEFMVNVLEEPVQKIEAKCEGFSLIAPEEKYIDGSGTIQFFASNQTNYPATIRLESNRIAIDDSVFSLPAGEEKTFTASIESDYESAELEYKVDVSDCGIPSQTTTVYSESAAPTPSELEGMDMGSSVAKDENGFLVTVSIYNPNSKTITGTLGAVVPQGWTVIGQKTVSVGPLLETVAALRIVPVEGFSGTYNGEITFSHDGIEESLPVELAFGPEGFDLSGTAFAVLGSGAFLVGLILAAVILIVMLFSGPSKQYFEPWLEVKETKK